MNNNGLALNSEERFLAIPQKDGLKWLNDVVTKARVVAGIKQGTDDDELREHVLLCKLLAEEIQEYFPTFTRADIEAAFKSGSRGRYGDFYGFNIKTFHQWMLEYSKSDTRVKSVKYQVSEKEYTKEEREKYRKQYWNGIAKAFQTFKQTGALDIMMPLTTYRKLWQNGLIETTEAEKSVYLEEAIKKLEREREKYLKPVNQREKNKLVELTSLLKNDLGKCLSKEQENLKLSVAAEIAIEEYFKKQSEPEYLERINKVANG